MKIHFSILLFCLSLSLTLANTPAVASEPGHVDLAPLAAAMDATPRVNLAFGPAMLGGFAETLRQKNPELATVLQSVKGLRVMVYEGVDSSAADSRIDSIIERLGADGWAPALTVRDGSTEVDLLLIESGQYVRGLTLLVRDGASTAVFVNIHGELDPVFIGQVIGRGKAMADFSLDGLMGQIQDQGNGKDDKED